MRNSLRWIVPVAVAATVAGGTAISSAQAGSAPEVPERTAQQVLAAVAGSNVTALSGTVTTRTDLGLPSIDLSSMGGGRPEGLSATDVQGLATRFLSGKNTLRVWADGETKQRVQLIDPFDELDVVRNGTKVWTWSAKQNEVGTATLPAEGAARRPGTPLPSAAADLTPAQMADRAIAAAEPTTSVTLGTPALVAGRPTYSLTLTPKTTETLVDRVVIAVDSERSVPLQVEVFARGHAQAAIQSGFTSVDFSRPAAETFTFTPPRGAKVTPLGDAPAMTSGTPSVAPPTAAAGGTARPEPTTSGSGWATVVEFPAGTAGADAAGAAGAAGLYEQLTKPVDGGRAFTTRLLSVLVTDDGRVLAGAVPVETLVAAARR